MNSKPTSSGSNPCTAAHRRTLPLAVEQVAVRRVRLQQAGHLLDEALQHRIDLELARHDLGCVQKRGLLLKPALVLRKQPRGLQRQW